MSLEDPMDKGGVFGPATGALRLGAWDVFGPTSFGRYLRENRIPSQRTAEAISIDTISRLVSRPERS